MAEGEHNGPVVDLTRETAVDGDDISVVPTEPAPDHKRRRRLVLAVVAGALVIVGVIGAFLAFRDDGTTTVNTETAAAQQRVPATTIVPAQNNRPAKAAATPRITTPARATTVTTAPLVVVAPPAPSATAAPSPGATNPATRGVVPPPAAPKSSPLSALVWTAPSKVVVATGQTKVVTVSVHNPTSGTVTLPHPLSCTPRLQHDEVCPEVAQLVGPGQIAAVSYSIDATGVAPGTYELRVEGVRKIVVTVTA